MHRDLNHRPYHGGLKVLTCCLTQTPAAVGIRLAAEERPLAQLEKDKSTITFRRTETYFREGPAHSPLRCCFVAATRKERERGQGEVVGAGGGVSERAGRKSCFAGGRSW